MGKPENVTCPDCGAPMRSRKSEHGVFWGCSRYPQCRGTRDSMGRSKREQRETRREDLTPPEYSWERERSRGRRWEQ
jgi:ssDNA-binding Zn-finger/Zn-ribbon topoisomerase 1